MFKKIFRKKQTEQELYWKEHNDELRQIEESGQAKLSILNELSPKIDTSIDITEIVSLKDKCIPILDWFVILDTKECPYHLTGGADAFKKNLLKRYNSALVLANKYSGEDFITVRNSLCKEVDNYDLCLSELSIQAGNGCFYGTTKRWLNTVKRMFDDNQIADSLSVYEECGLPKNIVYSKDVNLINSNLPFVKGSNEDSIFKTYQWAVNNRNSLAKLPLNEIKKSEYNLNIPDGEIIYHRINLVTLYEEKIIRTNIAYSGMRWSNGLLRAGTISAIGNDVKDFVAQDLGRLFITNKRIIFVGKQRNITKAIKIDDVLIYNLYKDGVLISQANKKGILFKFDQTVDYEIYQIGDGLNEFITVLNRIITGTEKENFIKKI